MGDGAFVDGYFDEVFLGGFNAFGDGCLNFVGFAEAPSYDTVFVAYNDDGGEGECASAFCDFSNAVDGDEAVFEFEVVG